jgi:hypothetical protein
LDREIIARLETRLPDALKEQALAALEEDLPPRLENGLRPLKSSLAMYAEQILTSQANAANSMNQRIEASENIIYQALKSQERKHTEVIQKLKSNLEYVRLEIERVPNTISNVVVHQRRDGLHAELRLQSAISSCHQELQTIRESLNTDGNGRVQYLTAVGQSQETHLREALHGMGHHFLIWRVIYEVFINFTLLIGAVLVS